MAYVVNAPTSSGGLAQNFSPAMVDSRGAYCLLTRKDSDIFLQKGPFFSKNGALLWDFEGAHRPMGQSATAYKYTAAANKHNAGLV